MRQEREALEEYLFYEDIQNEIVQGYRNGKRTGFREVVMDLRRCGQTRYGEIEVPDFSQWSVEDLQELRKLVAKIPIPVSRITSVVPSYRDTEKEVVLPGTVPVQISMEWAYTPEVYTVLKDYFAILYVIDGEGELFLKNDRYILKAGDVVIMAPEIPYRLACTENDLIMTLISRTGCFEECFFGMIQKNPLMGEFFKKTLYDSAKEYMLFHLPVDVSILQVIQNLFQESLSDDPYALDVFLHYLQIFYARILRCPEETFQVYSAEKDESGYTVFPAILQYIQKNYGTLSLESLAERFHYHPVYLSGMIRKNTGRTLTQIVTELKMKQAEKLLKSTKKSIGEISELTGYHSADHFSATFRKTYGVSPRRYREELRK